LPHESSTFDEVNKGWQSILYQMNHSANALAATQDPNLLNQLVEMNSQLETIEKSLDSYLETKRQAFPRFYFLSNDCLLVRNYLAITNALLGNFGTVA
jgi:dynein heavy chain